MKPRHTEGPSRERTFAQDHTAPAPRTSRVILSATLFRDPGSPYWRLAIRIGGKRRVFFPTCTTNEQAAREFALLKIRELTRQPSPAQPSPAQPSPAQLNPMNRFQLELEEQIGILACACHAAVQQRPEGTARVIVAEDALAQYARREFRGAQFLIDLVNSCS